MKPDDTSKSSSLDDNTRLAFERTFLGHERTLMAWVRTALSLITFGLVMAKFFEYLREKHGQEATLMSPRTVGILMIGSGLVLLSIAAVQHRLAQNAIRKRCPGLPSSTAELAGVFIAILGVFALVVAYVRHGSDPFL